MRAHKLRETRPARLWGPPTLLSNGYWGFFPPGVKRPERDADHSPPSSPEVKNYGSIPPLPQYVFMAWCSVKHRDNFAFIAYGRQVHCYSVSQTTAHTTWLQSHCTLNHWTVCISSKILSLLLSLVRLDFVLKINCIVQWNCSFTVPFLRT
jgi:hypothetical protein